MTGALAALGGPYASVSISDQIVTRAAISPASATATYTLANIGTDWLVGSRNGAGYEARVTVTSGVLGTGSSATGSWLNLGTTRAWNYKQSEVGVGEAIILVEIGGAGSGTALDSATITLRATVDPA